MNFLIVCAYEDLAITGANQPFGAHKLIKTFKLHQTRAIHNYLTFISVEKILSGIDIKGIVTTFYLKQS